VTILDSGVAPGQKIVVDGADRLRADAVVLVSESKQHGGEDAAAGTGSADSKATGKHQHKEQQ
jgi:hypothetical protein